MCLGKYLAKVCVDNFENKKARTKITVLRTAVHSICVIVIGSYLMNMLDCSPEQLKKTFFYQ